MGKGNKGAATAPSASAEERARLEANYSVTLADLCEMLALPPDLKPERLQQYGGVKGLAAALKTDLENGLDPSEGPHFHERRVVYVDLPSLIQFLSCCI